MREIIKTAKTVEEAIELALVDLSLTRDDVTFEVLEYPEKKFFFKKPAKVKVMEREEEIDIKGIFSNEKPQPKKENKPKPQPKVEKPQPKVEKVEKIEKVETVETPVVENQEISAKATYAMEFLHSVIAQFYDQPYTLKAVKSEKGFVIEIDGENIGSLIGRKGETMEAISYLTSLACNRYSDDFEKITVDIANYREKREKNLQDQARKIAIKVAKSGRPYTFDAMNPYDRRIIHAVIGEIEGVKSESKGEGGARRVMVFSTAPRKPRNNNNRNFKGSNANRSPRRDDAPKPTQKTRDEKLVDNAGASLYSKIEL